MKRSARSIVKYMLLIPWRILWLPRIYRRLQAIEGRVQIIEGHSQTIEGRLHEIEHTMDAIGPNLCVAETMMKALSANLRDMQRLANKLAIDQPSGNDGNKR